MFDSGFGENTLWTKPFNSEEGKEQICAAECTNYAPATTTHPISYTTPADCPDLMVDFWASGYGRRDTVDAIWETDQLQWVTTGHFSEYRTNVSALPWFEFQFLNSKKKANEIKNINISTLQLNDYTPFNYTGTLAQGLPIGIMPYDSIVEFEIDTTSLEDSSIIAFSTTPFSNGSTSKVFLEDTSDDNAIDLYIDGVDAGKSLGTLSAGKHTIKLVINGSTTKVPIFWKMGWPKNKTKSPRKSIAIPLSYTLTDNT